MEKDNNSLTDFFEGIDKIDISHLMKEYDIKMYKKNDDIYDIINDILEKRNISEEAFYIIDIGKLIRQYLRWKELLPDIEPYYAIKCNPNELVIKILASLGCNFDCASKNEIASVISITNDPSRIIFANPCKMSNQIKYARANDVDLMTFDSDHELYKIRLYHSHSDLILRIKVDDSSSKCKFSCKFGVGLEEGRELMAIAKSLKLAVVGIAFHIGSNAGSIDAYDMAIKRAREFFDMAKTEFNITFSILDIGGGFPGVDDENGVKFDQIADTLKMAIDNEFSGYPDLKVISEPGRFFSANSHTLVCSVIGKKEVQTDDNEKTFIYYLNDSVYGSFNCIFFDHAAPKILPFNERHTDQKYKSILFGNTCDGLDMITPSIDLPELMVGEHLYVEDFGAYTVSAASNFNGFIMNDPVYIMTC